MYNKRGERKSLLWMRIALFKSQSVIKSVRLYFLPTLFKCRILLDIEVFLVWLAFFFSHIVQLNPHNFGTHHCQESKA